MPGSHRYSHYLMSSNAVAKTSKQTLRQLTDGKHSYHAKTPDGLTSSKAEPFAKVGGTDDDMAAWLDGKTDAAGQPLRIVRQALPPGSLVALLVHSAHSVSPVVARPGQEDEDATRWASLFCYRRRATGPARSRWVTQQFEDAAVGGGEGVEGCLSQASDELRRLFRNDGGEADEA